MKAIRKIRVLLVDDHPVLRAGLRTISEVDPGLEVVAEAGNATQALDSVRVFKPDVLLLDIRLPGKSGFEVCRAVKLMKPAPCVLFLTSFADNALVLNAMEVGADGYLLKENEAGVIARAIRKVMTGVTVFDPIARKTGPETRHETVGSNRGLLKLSPQELRVLSEVGKGGTDKEVAAALGLQVKTVRHYLDSVFEKLNVNTRTQAALIWMRNQETFVDSCFQKIFEKRPPE